MRSNGHGKPVVALDVDGTLGDYHGHFLSFAEGWFGRELPKAYEINPGLRLHRFMGVPLTQYRDCKLAYRQGGLKRTMPVYPGAADMTKAIRKAGGEVWICTTRPYLRLDNIDPDTREWLKRNGIQFDHIIYGEQKYGELRRQCKGRVAAVLEDLPELWMRASKLFPDALVILRDQPYNRQQGTEFRAPTLAYAKNEILKAVDYWKAAKR